MWSTALALCAAGARWVLTLVDLQRRSSQLSAPRWVVGRAIGAHLRWRPGGMAGGSWVWGWSGCYLGTDQALLAAAATLLGRRRARPALSAAPARRARLDPPTRRWREPQIAVDIEPRSGPIIVTVEYLIRDEDVLRVPRRCPSAGGSGVTARANGPC